MQARRISLVTTRCSTCRSVGVYWNGALIRTITLTATSTQYRQSLTVTDFGSTRSGTLVIKSRNTGRVSLDGVGLSRSESQVRTAWQVVAPKWLTGLVCGLRTWLTIHRDDDLPGVSWFGQFCRCHVSPLRH